MTNPDPKQVVTDFFECFTKQDMKGARAALADDVDWIVLGGAKNIPFAGHFKGAESVIKAMSENTGAVRNLKVNPKWVVAEGDKVIILMNEHATAGNTGLSYDVDSVHVYSVKDGRIVRFENFFNPLPVLEASFGTATFIPAEAKSNRVVEERWVFFEGDKYHHYETFTYEYDELGKKKCGALNNFGRGIKYSIAYKYDEKGKGIGEEWVNSSDADDRYELTYDYDEGGNLILGGKGVGNLVWEFKYEYDAMGKKIKMTNTYSNGNSWEFKFRYDQNGECVLGEGKATSGLRCIITYEYA